MTSPTPTTEPAYLSGQQTPLPGARAALILLLAINLFNYIDRYVLAAVLPDIEKALFPKDDPTVDHANANTKLGLLTTAFFVSYMVLSPLFGWLADRTSRWLLVGIGVIAWSLASGASGWDWGMWGASLTTAYWLLLLTRCFVGVGEAAYGPVAPTVISDLYPVKVRGSVLAWFYMAIPVGSALGFALGGEVKASMSWRWAFFLVVPPGILLGILAFFMRDPRRGQADAGAHMPSHAAGWSEYRKLMTIPSYVFNTLGMTAMTFAVGGLASWVPKYLDERVKQHGEQTAIAGMEGTTVLGACLVLAGLVATLAGGIAGDRLRARWPGSYFLVSGLVMLPGFPLILLVMNRSFPEAWIYMFLALFCLFFNTGPTNTILANVTHPSIRASAFALNIFIIHALGDAISPSVMGWVADRWSLDVSFFLVSVAVLAAGIFWLLGARYLARDTERAPHSLD